MDVLPDDVRRLLLCIVGWTRAHPRRAFTADDIRPLLGSERASCFLERYLDHLQSLGYLDVPAGAPSGQWRVTPLGRRSVQIA